MTIDIIYEIDDSNEPRANRLKAFSKNSAMIQIMARSMEEAEQILEANKGALFSIMKNYQDDAPKAEPLKPPAMIQFLNTPKGHRLTKSVANARTATKRAGDDRLKMSEFEFLQWKIATGNAWSALDDSYCIGFRRGQQNEKKKHKI